MKCLYCSKELTNPKAKYCNDSERMRYKREGARKEETRTLITENPNKEKPEHIKIETLITPKKLVFTNESQEERVRMYKEAYPNSNFVPNWIAHGYNSKEEALRAAIDAVESSKSIKNLGL